MCVSVRRGVSMWWCAHVLRRVHVLVVSMRDVCVCVCVLFSAT